LEAAICDWTAEAIDQNCASAYLAYKRELNAKHLAHFRARPEARDPARPWAAVTRVAAFPDGWAALAELLPDRLWHQFHRFGGSSQTLAIALLSAATEADQSLSWLPGAESLGSVRGGLFEVELAEHVLNERPRQTTIDWLVLGTDGVIAAEAKFTEKGFGTCSCRRRSEGVCARRVLERPYWDVAEESLGVRPGGPRCALSAAYQPVRNLAAARAIARGRRHGFLLLYDERNPYFTGSGAWLGWVAVLGASALSLSWQQLLGDVSVERCVARWAREKHGLMPRGKQV
jgi:hypothetical protein